MLRPSGCSSCRARYRARQGAALACRGTVHDLERGIVPAPKHKTVAQPTRQATSKGPETTAGARALSSIDKEDMAMKTPPIVSRQEWEAARQKLLAKEKEWTHARDALAAARRRMPWLAVEKTYEFHGPEGKASLLDLFDGRRQLIVYRAFFEPGVNGWPDHACIGCS